LSHTVLGFEMGPSETQVAFVEMRILGLRLRFEEGLLALFAIRPV
jgi:hypothetical protein